MIAVKLNNANSYFQKQKINNTMFITQKTRNIIFQPRDGWSKQENNVRKKKKKNLTYANRMSATLSKTRTSFRSSEKMEQNKDVRERERDTGWGMKEMLCVEIVWVTWESEEEGLFIGVNYLELLKFNVITEKSPYV